MKPYFKDEDGTIKYVEVQFERKLRNLICRRIRLTRKVNLQDFNYFCTFTYDGEKHTEESFMRKLRGCFKMMCHRKGWKYVGVWERSPEKKRLHFHGLFYIPDGAMPGELVEVKDYSPIKKKVQTTIQNTYFNERFGRSDFKTVDDRSMLGEAIAYLTKYMEKTGEKMVYSKGLPQFFISDIMDEDIVCTIGNEEKKPKRVSGRLRFRHHFSFPPSTGFGRVACACRGGAPAPSLSYQDKHTPRLQIEFLKVNLRSRSF